jgi:hypothetical protein
MHACQTFMRESLAAHADGRDVKDRALGQGIACDASGCIGRLADGGRVAYALTADASRTIAGRPSWSWPRGRHRRPAARQW